jgi:ribosomal protein S18 acetylase RimI-like enzyme
MAGSGVELRPVADADREFLCRLYASTRAEEMAQTGWTEAEVESFLRFQFAAQDAFYRQQFGDASFDLVLEEGIPVGRLYVDRRDDEIRLIDIALLPEHRGRGIGSALLRELLAEAGRAGKPVRIHVEAFNPAMRLYERLGFRKVDENGVHHLMERLPDAPAAPARDNDGQDDDAR